MRYEFRVFRVRYRMFEPGERVRPTSARCPLPEGEHVVTRFVPPLGPGEDAVVFVEGHRLGVETRYLAPAGEAPASPWGPEERVLALPDLLAAAGAAWDRILPVVLEAHLDPEGLRHRLLAFVEANSLGEELAAYLASQHRHQLSKELEGT